MICDNKRELVQCLLDLLMHQPEELDSIVSYQQGMTRRLDEVGNVVEARPNGTYTIQIQVNGGHTTRELRPLRLSSTEP